MGLKFIITKDIKKANFIIGLKKYLKDNLKLKKYIEQTNIPIYSINKASIYQISKILSKI